MLAETGTANHTFSGEEAGPQGTLTREGTSVDSNLRRVATVAGFSAPPPCWLLGRLV